MIGVVAPFKSEMPYGIPAENSNPMVASEEDQIPVQTQKKTLAAIQ